MDTICSNNTLLHVSRSYWCYVWPGHRYGGITTDYGRKARKKDHKYWKTKGRILDCERRGIDNERPLYVIVVYPKPREKK